MPYDRTPTLSQTINAGLDFTSNAVNAYVDMQKEETRSDLIRKSAQLEKDKHDFLESLEMSNDYDNYDQKLAEFNKKITNNMSNKDSVYYCKHPFTAKKFGEMLTESDASMTNKVNEIQLHKRLEHSLALDQESVNLIMQTNPNQNGMNQIAAIYTAAYQNGRLNKQQYDNALRSAGQRLLSHSYNEQFVNGIEDAIRRGLTADEYAEELSRKNNFNLDVNAILPEYADPELFDAASKEGHITSTPLLFDSKAVIEDTKKNCIQTYKAKVADYQEKNEQNLSDTYNKIVSGMLDGTMTNEKLLTAINMEEAKIGMLDGQQLAHGRQVYWTDKYESFKKYVDKEAGGSGSTEHLPPFKSMIEDMPDTYLALIQQGKLNYYDAAEMMQQDCYDIYWDRNGRWNETKNMTDEEIQDYITNNYSKYGRTNFLKSEALNKVFTSNPSYKEIKKLYDQIEKEVNADLNKEPKKELILLMH